MAEKLYEQHAGQSDQQSKIAQIEDLICAVQDAVNELSPESKQNLRFLLSSRRPPARQQQLTRAQEDMEAARDSAAHLLAFALSRGISANSNDNEQLSEGVKYESSSEPDQAGPLIVSNAASTLTHCSTQVSAVNYSEAMENSVTEPMGTLQTRARKSKRTTGRSSKSNASKRSRGVPATTAEETDGSEVEHDHESGSISLSIIARRLKCRVPGCKKLFPDKVQLNDHHLIKHAIEKYACKVKDCTESYATCGELTTHRNTAHDNLGNDWPCGQCEMTCNNYKDLGIHVYRYHEYGLFACSVDKCDYSETTRSRVKHHQAKVHLFDRYRCTFAGCTSFFSRKSHLTDHFRKHSKEKPFLCSQCSKAFTHKHTLIIHERIHTGIKPYRCTWLPCDYTASNHSHVIRHIRSVHFGLPQSKTEQAKRGIIDTRDPRTFVAKTAITSN